MNESFVKLCVTIRCSEFDIFSFICLFMQHLYPGACGGGGEGRGIIDRIGIHRNISGETQMIEIIFQSADTFYEQLIKTKPIFHLIEL